VRAEEVAVGDEQGGESQANIGFIARGRVTERGFVAWVEGVAVIGGGLGGLKGEKAEILA
jgi:hypothetical protein